MPTETNLPAFRVHLANGDNYVTSMAKGTTLEEAQAYFLDGVGHHTYSDETTSMIISVEPAEGSNGEKPTLPFLKREPWAYKTSGEANFGWITSEDGKRWIMKIQHNGEPLEAAQNAAGALLAAAPKMLDTLEEVEMVLAVPTCDRDPEAERSAFEMVVATMRALRTRN